MQIWCQMAPCILINLIKQFGIYVFNQILISLSPIFPLKFVGSCFKSIHLVTIHSNSQHSGDIRFSWKSLQIYDDWIALVGWIFVNLVLKANISFSSVNAYCWLGFACLTIQFNRSVLLIAANHFFVWYQCSSLSSCRVLGPKQNF